MLFQLIIVVVPSVAILLIYVGRKKRPTRDIPDKWNAREISLFLNFLLLCFLIPIAVIGLVYGQYASMDPDDWIVEWLFYLSPVTVLISLLASFLLRKRGHIYFSIAVQFLLVIHYAAIFIPYDKIIQY